MAVTSKSSAEDEGMEQGDDGGDGGVDSQGRVQRRLAQNREAARKSRQRRKKYVNDLESEVRGTAEIPWKMSEQNTVVLSNLTVKLQRAPTASSLPLLKKSKE